MNQCCIGKPRQIVFMDQEMPIPSQGNAADQVHLRCSREPRREIIDDRSVEEWPLVSWIEELGSLLDEVEREGSQVSQKGVQGPVWEVSNDISCIER